MKSSKQILLVIITLMFAAIAFGIFWYNPFTSAGEPPKETIIEEEITSIEVNAENTSILLIPSENVATKLNVAGDRENFSMYTHVKEKNLLIETENKNKLFGSDTENLPLLTAYIPEQARIISLAVTTTIGDIQVRDIDAYEIGVKTESGSIDFEKMSMKYIDAETSDGEINMRQLEAHGISAESSEDIYMEDAIGSLKGKTSNGSINVVISEAAYSMDFNTENGGIFIQTEKPPIDVQIESQVQNGDINILGESYGNLIYGSGTSLIKLTANNGDISFTSEE
ncbi:DUF4097 family beta strand repeat-containing protein [Planococcus shixiaomingii]|uniref:DUF4097 family beta strand repeat-containing protein n=1 Tax=Planococcus shixiaomingii TaxID=3058393 RepID=UPI00262D805F|nr:DUF4097 family beta strand repeat-containing protein [Planococcus sp. N022]WKA55667.1 DUF4097 family beta strand repeat-containing protein [Planococcus sp. N022]